MKREHISIKSPCDGLNLSVLSVLPDPRTETVGIVQLIHGMSEHKERYIRFMEFLSSNGYICIIHDHRGHGRSVKSTADLGYLYGAGFTGLVQDAEAVTQYARFRWPGLPVHLMGHSMGSLVARSYAKRFDSEIDTLTLIGSPSFRHGVRAALLLTKFVRFFRGSRHVSLLIDRLAAPRSEDRNSGSAFSWICSRESVVRAYEMDALCGFTFTLDGYEALLGLMLDVYSRDGWQTDHPSLPVHFASGGDDVCLVDVPHFEKSVSFMRDAGYASVTWKLYENLRHEILNENGCGEVWSDLLSFLREKE